MHIYSLHSQRTFTIKYDALGKTQRIKYEFILFQMEVGRIAYKVDDH